VGVSGRERRMDEPLLLSAASSLSGSGAYHRPSEGKGRGRNRGTQGGKEEIEREKKRSKASKRGKRQKVEERQEGRVSVDCFIVTRE